MTLGLKSEKRHRVPVRTHCEVWREFVQVVTERQVVEKEVSMEFVQVVTEGPVVDKEVSMLSGGNVTGGG